MDLVTNTEEEKYERLCMNAELYPRNLYSWVEDNDVHWNRSSWRQRELSLRHDMCCLLFCNMVRVPAVLDSVEEALNFLKRKREENGETSRKKARRDEPGPSSQGNNSSESEDYDSSNEDYMEIGESGIIEEGEDEEPVQEYTEEQARERERETAQVKEALEHSSVIEKRFICLETLAHADKIQTIFAKKFGIEGINNMFDIIDQEKRILIEMKISLSPKERIREFNDKYSGQEQVAIIIYRPDRPERESVGFEDFTNTGDDKVIGFLSHRKAVMEVLQMSDSDIKETNLKTATIFKSPQFIDFMIEYIKHVTEGEREPIELTKNIESPITLITAENLLENLEDPAERPNCPEVIWKGKILPPLYTKYVEVFSDRDSDMIDEIFELLRYSEFSSKEYWVGKMYEELMRYWESNTEETNSIVFCKPKEERELKVFYEKLGIGTKKKMYSHEEPNIKQPEFKEIQKQRYVPWIEDIIENLSEYHPYKGWGSIIRHDRMINKTEIERIAEDASDFITEKTSVTNNGLFMSTVSNLYSRLGGTYLVGHGRKTSHSAVASIPLVTNIEKDGIYRRLVTGICFRGPHHVKRSSDRIGIITMEFIRKGVILPLKNSEHRLVSSMADFDIMIRQNSYKKCDPSFEMFIHNSLYLSSNLLGEILINNKNANNVQDIRNSFIELQNNENFHKYMQNRISESILMAVIGNTRDEGYFAMARKIFMVMLEISKGHKCQTWNIEEFCEKINETLIDNPLSMHFQNSILYALTYLCES